MVMNQYGNLFNLAFREAMRSAGSWRIVPPGAALQEWEDFVESCEDGYDDNIYEYANDLSIRTTIEEACRNPAVGQLPETAQFLEAVRTVDRRFWNILGADRLPNTEDRYWWEAHLPRYGGIELANDLHGRHGVSIDVVDQ